MNYSLKNFIIGFFLVVGLSAILKFYFDTPNIGILFLVGLSLIAGLTKILVFAFLNPPSWLYRIRLTILGIFYGIFIGIMLYGMEAIDKNSFIIQDLLKFILIGAVIGGVFNNSMMFSQSQKLKRRKGLFLLERQLVKDFALLIKQNGEKIKGKLVLTNDHLIFLGNRNDEKVLEKEVHEIIPRISKVKFLGIPDGFILENDGTLLKVPFPYYWMKRIDKRKKFKNRPHNKL
ncbi:MAG: hypothetical protein KUL78_00545 [Flavobacterium sp.]|nr:hypothetical protein [Flavobacterium sp.]